MNQKTSADHPNARPPAPAHNPTIPRTINITAQDIENGDRSFCTGCPMALAINRVLLPGYHSYIGSSSCIDGPDYFSTIELPLEAHHWIVKFDGHYAVTPIAFIMELPVAIIAIV